ncbi:MAG: guanylate kinase [Robiginitomaculum sp.]
MKKSRRGLMIILSSPSGAGKSTLTRTLLKEDCGITLSVSATTRPPRSGEVDGVHYFFVSKAKFDDMREDEEFLEYAKVFDNYYGTPRGPVKEALGHGKDVLFDIDWQGAQQLTQAASDDLVNIFILPPSKRELESRLKTRAQDSASVIAKRMAKSESEMSHWAEYDYVIVNDDIEGAMDDLRTIIHAERMKRRHQLWLGPFIKGLTEGQ